MSAPVGPRVVLAGGGTAGHVSPALATADALRALRADAELEFVGTAAGLESELVPAAGWPFHAIKAAPLRRGRTPKALIANLAVPFTVLGEARRLARLLRERRVAACCVFGGYVSGPLALAARLARVPLVLHEQNAVPGLANRIAARWAAAVAVSVPGVADRFPHPERVTMTGNPVRAALAGLERARLRDEAARAFDLDPDRRTVLVFGGSLGARRINDAVVAARWSSPDRVQILHAAGRGDHARVDAAWQAAPTGGPRVVCVPFIERMDLAYALADVVVCRSGASTIAELSVLGLPSVLVPYPYAAADEQTANARALSEAGAAVMVPDGELDGARLAALCDPLLSDDEAREAMARAARALGRPDAARDVAALVLDVAGLATVDENTQEGST